MRGQHISCPRIIMTVWLLCFCNRYKDHRTAAGLIAEQTAHRVANDFFVIRTTSVYQVGDFFSDRRHEGFCILV
jgi:glyoxylate carboligase